MSATDTDRRSATVPAVPQGLTEGRLPRWAPIAVVVAALAISIVATLPAGSPLPAVVALTAVLAVVGTWASSRIVEGSRKATDRLVTALVTVAFLIAMIPLVSVVWTVIAEGAARLDAEFFTYSMRGIVGEGGGALHAIWGTILVTAAATVISVPIGLLAAVYLVEYGRGRLARALTFFVDVMTGIPSIVAGLFAIALFTAVLGPRVRFGIIGAVALAVLMIPVVVRSCEEMLKLVPHELREASYALGVPKWRTVVKVVLRTAIGGIATGITLAVARVTGETAPLLVTLGLTTSTNFNLFDGRMATLPVFSYFQYTQPGVPPEFSIERAWTAALVLIALVMGLNLLARLISRFFAPKRGR